MAARSRKTRSKCPAKPVPKSGAQAFADAARAHLPHASPEVRAWLEALLTGESATWLNGVEVRAPAPEALPLGVEPERAEERSARCSPGRA